ncbi:MAG: phage head closure protein [Rickettsiales bacterium]|nr:phage head closure protein [Rickettsiales bacterium]
MSKRMTCSRLRHRVSLQQEVSVADGGGGFTQAWQEVAMLWAEIEPITGADSRLSVASGKEVLMADQMQSQVSHKVTLRWRNDVAPAMRLVFEGRAFNIRYVAAVDGGKELLQLLAQEGVAN